MRRTMRLFMAGLMVLTLAPACASRTKTVKTTEEKRYPAERAQQPPEPVVVERTTTTTTESKRPARGGVGGVLSTTVHVVGEILALPFRLVAGLLRLIF